MSRICFIYKKKNSSLFVIFIGPLFLLFFWWLIAHSCAQPSLYLATPEETIQALLSLFTSTQVFIDIYYSLIRTVIAFMIAVIFGVPMGLLIGSVKKIFISFEVVIDFFRSLPSTALFPLFLLIFGINDFARIGIAAFVSFWIILFNTLYGLLHGSKTRIKVAKAMKVAQVEIIRDVVFWETLPYIFAGMRLALSVTLIIIIITEMVIPPRAGLGVRIYELQQNYKIDQLYALILITGLLGYLINKIFALLESQIIHWANK